MVQNGSARLIDQLAETLGSGSDEDRLAAVRQLEPSCEVLAMADAWLWTLVSRLLRLNYLKAVARLLWTEKRFNTGPACVQRIWNAIESESKLILLGCGSAGKTYTSITWFLLDWLRDPKFTNTKIISTSAGHARSNVFSTLHMLHSESRIKLPGERLTDYIGIDTKKRVGGIARVSIPPGASGRGALQGFHPIPRDKPDPIFGDVGKVRALVDEAEEVPVGLWLGINNMLVSMHGSDLIKITAACNPRDILSPLAGYAQPPQGWTRVKADIDKEWTSKERWKVVRIDGADLENVREKKTIYPGLMTYEGFENLRLKGGGNSIDYWTFGRGLYSLEGSQNQVIPLSFLDDIVGTLIFVGQVTAVGAVDVAFEGDDEAILVAGRYGLATGYREPGGKVHFFDKQRFCLQVDQFYPLAKVRTLELAESIMAHCHRLRIAAEWFLVDRTGSGTGVHDALISLWDTEVSGVNWGQEATEKPILEDDSHMSIEENDGLVTEFYMALRRWVEHGYVKLSPTLGQDNIQKVFSEVTQRTYALSTKGPTGMGRVRVQPKKEFKARYGWSPDRADALVMMLHQCRMLGPERARATRDSIKRTRRGRVGIIEKGEYVRWNEELDR